MAEFTQVASLDELTDGGKTLVEVDDRLVVLFRVGEDVFCLDDVCTHDGGPLGEGVLTDDGCIACPRHGAKFEIRTGKALTMPATEDTIRHDVKIERGAVFVALNED